MEPNPKKSHDANQFFVMDQFLSCDWGTSSFRLRLIALPSLEILTEEKSNQGIAHAYNLWKAAGVDDPKRRLPFYLNLVLPHIEQIEKKAGVKLKGVPLVFSGMASSSIGMMNLPYGELPFPVTGEGLHTSFFDKTKDFDHPVLIISGIQTANDVMRGEETQLIGVLQDLGASVGKRVFVLPGTHSKHILVEDGQVTDFKTYMTGEYFDLLSKKSILSASVEEPGTNGHRLNEKAFNEGVTNGAQTNLLTAGFWVRTNELFDKMTKKENHDYLSGLLIGSELNELRSQEYDSIYLCCGSNLKTRYEEALRVLDIKGVHVFSGETMDKAVVRGQFQIYKQLQKR